MNLPYSARLHSHLLRIASFSRVTLARATGAKIGAGCRIGACVDLMLGPAVARRGRLVIGENCEFAQGVVLHPYGGSIVLSRDIYLGQHVVIFGHGGVEIGQHTLVAMHCRIVSSAHTIPSPDKSVRSMPDELRATRIGVDVWLGAGVTVLGGVTIGDSCIVGAGAVVTKDLPPRSIAVGVPARVVGTRS